MNQRKPLAIYIHPQSWTDLMQVETFGLDDLYDESFVRASLVDLNLEVMRHKRSIELGISPDDDICPWGDGYPVLVEEGFYTWSREEDKYVKVDVPGKEDENNV
ncbi:hypothetical protein MF069_36500 [Paenibacillus mucilaginosus]|uniref:hypothetical protein n=1 Tax=Paenibacillus mucilaginosus TaxID=61624 RepID=UPI001EEF7976|nr:hypothetical protein [Paenibacillus mucilaginosus]MCG7218202.1 hypothetical protein [Paenibacillus mucilaginosus]